jgi:two-component system, chemotaxis family, chemotaxis protein CheY
MTANGASVMVIDDDEAIRYLAKLLLEGEGFRVATAVDGLDAWRQLEAGAAPSLILLDLMMPRMDGEQFLHTLRASRRAGIPVVVMSGHSAASAVARGLEANACLTKPFELEDLLETVARLTGAQGGVDTSPPA